VRRILEAWNIGADSVVFVDDSPMELAEVAGAHPGIETIRFPKNDYAGMYALLRQLSDLFGKDQVSGEDAIRLESLRAGASFRKLDEAGTHGAEDFLKQAEAVLAVDFEVNPRESRVIELVNKTNQFNLNGRRYTPGEWAEQSARSGAFTATVRYEDKFGPLGTIGVISGTALNGTATIDVWVMSCRAFARRIEHQCVRQVFEQLNVRNLVLDFQRTPKNGPIRDFLTTVCGAAPDGSAAIDRESFERTCPPLYHTVLDTRRAEANA
jgi:FkbH-like protein